MQRRMFLSSMIAATACASASAQQGAGTLTTYVAFPAGGLSDVFARVMGPAMAKRLSRSSVVENLTGASGSLAATKVLSRGGTGDALFLGSPTELILAPATLLSVKYKPSDFRPVTIINRMPLALYVRQELPASNVDELVAYAKSHPDTPLSYGSVGLGSVYHLAGEAFSEAAGVKLTHVPYRGGPPMLQDIMGGRVDMALFPLNAKIANMTVGGKMRALAVTGAARSNIFPAVPTFSESKTLPLFSTVDVWAGVFVPATTPEPLIETLHRAAQDAIAAPEVRQQLEAPAGSAVMGAMSLEQLATFYATEISRYTKAIKLARLEQV